jgi:glycosyltransferase involved in cell wall biosynthesis
MGSLNPTATIFRAMRATARGPSVSASLRAQLGSRHSSHPAREVRSDPALLHRDLSLHLPAPAVARRLPRFARRAEHPAAYPCAGHRCRQRSCGRCRATVASFLSYAPFPVFYVHEPRRGIAQARNAAMAKALEIGADWLAMIDDDEVADPDCHERLVWSTRRRRRRQQASRYRSTGGAGRQRCRWATDMLASLLCTHEPELRQFYGMDGDDGARRARLTVLK